MPHGFSPGYAAVIYACDELHFEMPSLRTEYADDSRLMAVWRSAANAILAMASELDVGYSERDAFLYAVDRCEEMLESVGLPRLGEAVYLHAHPTRVSRPRAEFRDCA
ncbi:hypothetical protein ACFFGH_17260 [Lysobacter korlensis]|uniref:Uncharacterized protein n=1 Tax=Lysobacter korlensis TaxID=553636 RepID=A0ABV6RUK3_9GAMM